MRWMRSASYVAAAVFGTGTTAIARLPAARCFLTSATRHIADG